MTVFLLESGKTSPMCVLLCKGRYKVATVNWDRVANPFIISVWIIFAGLAKLGELLFHRFLHITFQEVRLL